MFPAKKPLFATLRPCFQHIGLELASADLAPARRFWAVLGFSELEVPASLRERAVWLGGPAGQVHLLVVERASVPAGVHVALEIGEGLESVVASLRRSGVRVQERQAHWGAARVLAEAPGGHRIELMAHAPPSRPLPAARQ